MKQRKSRSSSLMDNKQIEIMNIKRALQKVSVLLLVTCVMFSCEPEIDRFSPIEGEQIDVNKVLEDLEDEVQQFTIDGDVEEQIITEKKAVVTFPADIFQFAGVGGGGAGDGVSGMIDIEVIEIYERGDIFLYRVPTVSDGRLIESDAVLHISAFQNGEELELIPGKQIKINVTNDNPRERMELFYGEGDNSEFDWLEADGDENTWDNINIAEWATQDSLEQVFGFGYECFSDRLEWINVDIFVDTPEDQKTSVCIELPEIYTNTNTYAAMIFKDINSVVGLQGNADTMQFCEPYGLSPIGMEIYLVVISSQGEDVLHFAIEEATISEDLLVEIFPQERTKEEIKMILDSL